MMPRKKGVQGDKGCLPKECHLKECHLTECHLKECIVRLLVDLPHERKRDRKCL